MSDNDPELKTVEGESPAFQTLDWHEGDMPYSQEFGDHFYCRTDGRLECGHVFLSGNGLPDRCYIRRGRVVWIEWKRPGRGEDGLSAIQVRRIKEMREHGAEVYVLDNMEQFKEIMK